MFLFAFQQQQQNKKQKKEITFNGNLMEMEITFNGKLMEITFNRNVHVNFHKKRAFFQHT